MTNKPIHDLSVLILDDNIFMARILRAILLGYGVRNAYETRDAVTAFEICRIKKPDAALVDFKLDDLNGAEFVRLVRTGDDSPNPEMPILMVTAYTDEARLIESINAGVDGFIAKPVTAKTLLTQLHGAVYRQRPFVQSKRYYGPDRRRRIDEAKAKLGRRLDDIGSQSVA